jgi:uncharacterized lipoprotein YehR (DUF1307 family)
MNEIVLELFLVVVMAFFMIFGIVGCRRKKEQEKAGNPEGRENR